MSKALQWVRTKNGWELTDLDGFGVRACERNLNEVARLTRKFRCIKGPAGHAKTSMRYY